MATHTINANGNYPDDDGVKVTNPRSLMVENPAGATVKLQYNPDPSSSPASANWRDVDNGEFTAASVKNVNFMAVCRCRINVTNYSSEFTVEF